MNQKHIIARAARIEAARQAKGILGILSQVDIATSLACSTRMLVTL